MLFCRLRVRFIAAHGLAADDIDAIGVPATKLGLRKKLMALYKFPKQANVIILIIITPYPPTHALPRIFFSDFFLNLWSLQEAAESEGSESESGNEDSDGEESDS